MTRASGRKAHSHGAEFEDYLERVVFKAALDSGYFARIDKQNPTYVASRSRAGVTFKPKARSGADWIALGGPQCKWSYIAIEAKSVDGDSLPRSAISTEQAAHLQAATDAGQLGLLLIHYRLETPTGLTYAVRWNEKYFYQRGNGRSLPITCIPDTYEVSQIKTLAETLSRWITIP
jgi:penicillin-binding protein-related factor A (putative recombinase)